MKKLMLVFILMLSSCAYQTSDEKYVMMTRYLTICMPDNNCGYYLKMGMESRLGLKFWYYIKNNDSEGEMTFYSEDAMKYLSQTNDSDKYEFGSFIMNSMFSYYSNK